MKPSILKSGQRNLSVILLLTILQLTNSSISFAQLPDCITGNTAYAIFNDSLGSGPATPSQIRPVNLTTGAIGPLVGGVSYLISKTSGGSTYYGSSALGVDIITNRMYVMTQMSSGASFPKDIITINPVTTTRTVIATTVAALGNYHFVKLAMHPTNGFGYAVGVVRDTTLVGANQVNPLIRFSTCGAAPAVGCANASVITLGYLPTLPGMFRWELFNGDIAFDAAGNLYFASAAFRRVNGANRYTDARLFRINAADIPGVAGAGVIPMTLIADYNGLDSTVINGIALNSGGNMYITTRRFNGNQSAVPAPTFLNQLYSSGVPGVATLMPFAPKPVAFSVADLASCYFPLIILPEEKLELAGKYSTGYSTLLWRANNNKKVKYFEIQRSEDFTNNYITIATVARINPDAESQAYAYKDPQDGFGKNKYYRVREVMFDGKGIYSNVLKISFNQKFNLVSKPKPNPFISKIELNIQLQSVNQVSVRLIDESGRLAIQKRFEGQRGENRFSINGISHLKSGIYILEISAEGEVVREKLVKE